MLNPDVDVGEVGWEVNIPSSSSQPPTERAPEIDRKGLAGVGMWLGVFGRVRGVAERLGVIARDGVCDLDGVLKVCDITGGWKKEDDCVVELEDMTGDQGRDEAMETLDRLRLDGVASGGTGGTSSL